MNKTDYLIEDDYTPQSRYDNLKEVEPEFWKHKKLEQMNKPSGNCSVTAAANAV